MQPVKVLHLVADLNGFGGTENTLLRYLTAHVNHKEQHQVLVMKSAGEGHAIGAQIRALGFGVTELHLHKPDHWLRAPVKFWRLIRGWQPTVLSAWLYHPILLAELVRRLSRRPMQIVWHIRSLPFSKAQSGRARLINFLAWLSRRSDAPIVCNSAAAMVAHKAIGYREHGWVVNPNGLDANVYAAGSAHRDEIRRSLGLGVNDFVICTVGRFVPEKGHSYLFEALRLSQHLPEFKRDRRVCFMGIGHEVTAGNSAFVGLACTAFDSADLLLMGKRQDIPDLLAAADLFVMPSVSESFPNAVIEAMAAGRLVVATKVGAISELGLREDLLALPGEATSLASAIDAALALSPDEIHSITAHQMQVVRDRFTVVAMIHKFDVLFGVSHV